MCNPKTAVLSAVVAFAVFAAFAAPVRIDVRAGESLLAVRDKVRAIPAAERNRGVEIVLSPGEYVLTDGMELTAEDSGADGAPVLWRAAEQGKAIIVGAARILPSSFAKVDDPALLARVCATCASRGWNSPTPLTGSCT